MVPDALFRLDSIEAEVSVFLDQARTFVKMDVQTRQGFDTKGLYLAASAVMENINVIMNDMPRQSIQRPNNSPQVQTQPVSRASEQAQVNAARVSSANASAAEFGTPDVATPPDDDEFVDDSQFDPANASQLSQSPGVAPVVTPPITLPGAKPSTPVTPPIDSKAGPVKS